MSDAATSRFPFGVPRGWFVVAMSSELGAGPPTILRALDRDLVLYRGESGAAHLVDAYCPHLGAHLGHGGKVEGESLRCPFHGWRFEADGRCAEVPNSKITPDKARLRTYPVREQNGTIYAFHDPSQRVTPWDLPALDEDGWTAPQLVHWKGLRTHPQEVFENTVDTAHIGPVHAGRGANLKTKPRRDGEKMIVDVAFSAPGDIVGMPGTINDVELEVTMIGLGAVFVQTHVTNVGVRARQRIHVTPIDEATVDIRGIVQVKVQDDAAYTEEIARIFYEAYVEDFAKDFPIWENKRYLRTPLLSPADGPIGLYRRWCEQFYDDVPATRATAADAARPDVTRFDLLRRAVLKQLEPARATFASLAARATTQPSPVQPAATRETAPSPAPRSVGRVASADDYFRTLPERFVPAAAAGVDAVFQWELGEQTFHARVSDGALDVKRGPHERPTVALVMPEVDYVRVVNGDIDGTWAFTSGLGKVRGSLSAAMKMRSLFPA